MSEQNVGLIHSIYDAFGRGDIDSLVAVLDEDVEWVVHGPEVIPFAGRRVGHLGVRSFFAELDSAVEVQGFRPAAFIDGGDHVVVLGDEQTRVKHNGRIYATAWVHIWFVGDGQVRRLDEFLDSAQAADAFRA